MNFNHSAIESLRERSIVTLKKNWREGFTVPSANLYPFQWLWDSGFVSMGWSLIDKDKARLELETLFGAQWENGMIPHIIFHNDSPEKQYFPDAKFHGSEASDLSPKHVKTTGMTQPPVLGFVLEFLFENEIDKQKYLDFYRSAVKSVFRFHQYLYKNRDPKNEGLVYIRHNWESGTDNCAVWDSVWARYSAPTYDFVRKDTLHVDQSQRPTKKDYNYYMNLIELSRNCGYDEQKMYEILPFLIQDPLFNSILAKSNQCLSRLSNALDLPELSVQFDEWYAKTAHGINTKLFDDVLGQYTYFDLKNNVQISEPTAMGFAPLFAGIASEERANKMAELILSKHFLGENLDGYLCPSLGYSSSAFDPVRYWRGPIWPHINWLLAIGFKQYGFLEIAEKLRNDIIELSVKKGFYEYFSPIKSEEFKIGYGGEDFSWTAAILLLIME